YRRAGAGHVQPAHRRRTHAALRRVRLRQLRHGRGLVARRRCAVATCELRRNIDGDPHGELRYPHVHTFTTEAGGHLIFSGSRPGRSPLVLALACGLGLTVQPLPARAIDPAREEVAAFIADMQSRHGFEPAALGTLFTSAETRSSIVDAMNRPAEK